MICRLCLSELKEFIAIFGKDDVENQSSVAEKVAKYLQIELVVEDDVSNKMCKSCWAHLEDFHIFWVFIEEKQQTLLSGLNDFKCSPCSADLNDEEPLLMLEKNTVKDELLWEQPIDALVDEQEPLEADEFEAASENVLEVTDTFEETAEGDSNVQADEFKAANKDLLESTDTFEEPGGGEVTSKDKSAKRICRQKKTVRNSRLRSPTINAENNEDEDNPKQKKARNGKKNPTILQHDAYIAEHSSLSCCICKQLLHNFAELKTHFRKAHNCRGYMICCNNRYAKRTQYVDHLKLHNNPEFFKCKECDKLLANRNSFQNHMASCHPSEEELKFHCNFCEKKFAKQYILDYHLNSHRAGEKKHKCEVCQKGYRSLTEMKQHQKRVHFSTFKIMCDICGKHFKSKQSFQKHSEVMHQTVERPEAECKICGKWLKDDRSLYKHMYKHRDENSGKEFVCSKCGAVKKSRQTLNSHIRYHHSETMHKCTLCEKQFKRVRCLEEHMATHTGQALYTCSFCPQTFKSHANMHNHKKKVHPNDWVRKYSRPSKATACEVLTSDKINDDSLK